MYLLLGLVSVRFWQNQHSKYLFTKIPTFSCDPPLLKMLTAPFKLYVFERLDVYDLFQNKLIQI